MAAPNPQLATALPEHLQQALGRARVEPAELRYLRVGSGRPVVLLHTLRTQLDYFGPLLERLDTTRIEVIAVDLPGHGHSSAPRVDYSAGYFSDTIEQLLEQCELRMRRSSASRSAGRSHLPSRPAETPASTA